MQIAILVNEPGLKERWPQEELSDQDVRETANSVFSVLEKLGHECGIISIGQDPMEVIKKIKDFAPDAAFNLCETVCQSSNLEPALPFLLRWMNIPFTGNSPEALSLLLNKGMAKRVLRDLEINTPDFAFLNDISDLKDWPYWPAILKPSTEDASLGIDSGSVVNDSANAESRFNLLQEKFASPVLIEKYIDGREIIVSVLQGEEELLIGTTEINFLDTKPGKPNILTFASKWLPESADYQTTPVINPANLEPALDWKLRVLARTIFNNLGLSGYARIDFRVDKLGVPWVLEVNPNPNFTEIGGGFSNTLPQMGIDYAKAVELLIKDALKKKK